MSSKHLNRSLQIFRAFARYRCYFFLENTKYHSLAKTLGTVLVPTANKNCYIMSDGQKLVNIFQELGPAFIKLGQSFSVRPDIIGDDIADELSRLQDRLPPFLGSIAKQIIEKELGKKTTELFKTFDDQPAAAASISQVHFARDLDGNEVAVKILRPNIEVLFFRDINLLFWIAKIINNKFPKYRRLKLSQLVGTIAASTKIEMDLLYEAASASELAENFKDDEDIRIPKVYWQKTSPRVLVIERFSGIRIDDAKRLQESGLDLDEIVKKSTNIFLKQTLRDGFFHADMHPGNILIDENGNICVFDFGIMGRMSKKDRIFIAEMLLGFLNKDYKKVADIHFDAGIVPSNQSRELFAQACRSIGEPIFDLPQNQISIAKLLQKLFRVTEQFKMEGQPQFLLLQKTMMMAEGIARRLSPQVNFWEISRELIEEWGKENLGPKAKFEENIRSTVQTFKDISSAARNLSKVITPNGVIIHQQHIDTIAKSNASENFWKGFITAVLLSILSILMVIKF
jgi:ubiquinone biosynthesis protein